jgi:hypothetical protein
VREALNFVLAKNIVRNPEKLSQGRKLRVMGHWLRTRNKG